MDIFFWGSGRAGSVSALRYVASRANVIGCSCDDDELNPPIVSVCEDNRIGIISSDSLVGLIEKGEVKRPDWGLCYSYHALIPQALIHYPLNGIVNFHPAPLPYHRGIAGASYAKYNSENEWGVSSHYIDEAFDTGDIISVRRFAIDSNKPAIDIDNSIQKEMLSLFKEIVDYILLGSVPPRVSQNKGEGHYYSRKSLNSDKKVGLAENSERIKKKIEAFWFPPYEGAFIEISGDRYTLVNETVMKEIAEIYRTQYQKGFD